MIIGPRLTRFGSRRVRITAILGAAAVALTATTLLAGLRPAPHDVTPDEPGAADSELVTTEIIGIRTIAPPEGVTVDTDVLYGTRADGAQLTLDVCSPAEAAPEATASPAPTATDAAATEAAAGPASARRPAVLSVHGGSWNHGDKGNSDWRAVCTWLASEGFVAYSVNYRLVPDALFPAAIDDLGLAVEWMRQPDHALRYGIDPDRIGAFGGSAGGNLAALLGARGSGPLTEGSRVAAVAELTAPVDLSYQGLVTGGAPFGLQRLVQRYLGCAAPTDCSAAEAASVANKLDPSDPPVFIGASMDEFIPLSQSTGYADALESQGIPHELVTVPGSYHSIGILDEAMRAKVSAFLHAALDD
ncbi:alpha/beta hydrolase [Cryobacterium sp. TmT2-59]|uniref:alpha/beta hydrolase n=1 Tax=unclassified Cryobacterium TaxID=2649013 RepID=UPI00106AC0C5|nr:MULTISPECIES: alpha/beta hydrolase [unclassified Cryobacterium]TFC89136.1 alpha/beta hydrolase [Cryobacterium sp. TmT2-59]TFD22685.1 alpha/beta hydrolase [Cryobacterium sp. TMT2-23]